LKPKDLIGIPWSVAFALQADGWWLRSEIIWAKTQTMPESVTDRPTKSHEQIFLLAKSADYYYDQKAIMEPCVSSPSDIKKMVEGKERIGGKNKELLDVQCKASALTNIGRKRGVGGTALPDSFKGSLPGRNGGEGQDRRSELPREPSLYRNKRDVWTCATASFSGAHFATFPPNLIRPMVLAGCPVGGTIIDPFGGSGTTGEVAEMEGRNSILIELSPDYCQLARKRTEQTGLFAKQDALAKETTP
jgi:DNA modification methylase